MSLLRVAVIGAGHLGSIHARLLSTLEQVELVAIVDPTPEARDRAAAQFDVPVFSTCEQLTESIDAAVVATPTIHHFDVAIDLLRQGVHLLIEKPLTTTVAQANHLITEARARHCVLQVGHVERFNPAWSAVQSQIQQPRYIEATRAGTYTFRSTDVSIVLDLMIHDLDLVLSLVRSEVTDVDAMGLAIFGPHEDLAHARLRFANGCIADLKASRVSYQAQRTMQVFSPRAFAAIDFATGTAELVRPAPSVLKRAVNLTTCTPDQQAQVQQSMFEQLLRRQTVATEPANAILEEQRDFATAIVQGNAVQVPGEQGRDALAVAESIVESIRTHRWNGLAAGPVGPHASLDISTLWTRRAA